MINIYQIVIVKPTNLPPFLWYPPPKEANEVVICANVPFLQAVPCVWKVCGKINTQAGFLVGFPARESPASLFGPASNSNICPWTFLMFLFCDENTEGEPQYLSRLPLSFLPCHLCALWPTCQYVIKCGWLCPAEQGALVMLESVMLLYILSVLS